MKLAGFCVVLISGLLIASCQVVIGPDSEGYPSSADPRVIPREPQGASPTRTPDREYQRQQACERAGGYWKSAAWLERDVENAEVRPTVSYPEDSRGKYWELESARLDALLKHIRKLDAAKARLQQNPNGLCVR
jgi:hypothetical protein